MRTLTAFLAQELASGTPRLAVCWKITRRDGYVIRSTEHNRDLAVSDSSPGFLGLDGIYEARKNISASSVQANSDLSVSNLEVTGALKKKTDSSYFIGDFAGDDIAAALYDRAGFVIFQVCWAQPDQGVLILMRGTLGTGKRNDDGQFTYELRDLTQALSQVQGRSFGILCDADFGDARCGFDLNAGFRGTGVVDAVTDNRQFAALIVAGSPSLDESFWRYGKITFTSGENAGFAREIVSIVSGDVQLFEAFPKTISPGDTFDIEAGCDHELNIDVEIDGNDVNPNGLPTVANGRVTGDCAVKYQNGANFRGFVNKPGPDTQVRLRVPPSKKAPSGGKK